MSITRAYNHNIGIQLLRALASHEKNVFTNADALKFTRSTPEATKLLLSDLVRRKWLIRLKPGLYLIVQLSAGVNAEATIDWRIVARHMIQPNPYFIAYYSALEIHEMTAQPLSTIYIATSSRRKTRKALGATFHFVYAPENKIWGIREEWITPSDKVIVSDLERTIIDCLSDPKYCGGVSELAKGLWRKRNELDYPKLAKYVDRFGSKAVAKRLGFLLELYGIGDNTQVKLRKFVTSTYTRLDPSLPNRGKYISSWRLRINLNPEELKEIIKT